MRSLRRNVTDAKHRGSAAPPEWGYTARGPHADTALMAREEAGTISDETHEAGDDEPDPRFLLAGERTFLAWVRTGLALLAAGLGVILLPTADVPVLPRVLSAGLLLVAFATSATAYPRWRRVQTALRGHTPLPAPGAAWLVSYAVAAAALIGLLLVLTADG